MNRSESSSSTSTKELEQMPLKGFIKPLKTTRQGWEKFVECIEEGRYRIGQRKIKK